MSKKYNIDEVKFYYESQGCELLVNEYVHCKVLMPYKCRCGEIVKKTFDGFKSSWRCKKCRYLESGKNRRIGFDEVCKTFTDAGLILLETEYHGCFIPMQCLCSCGEKYRVSYHSVQQGTRNCPKCVGNEKLTYDYVKSKFEEVGYTLLSTEYKKSHDKLEFICNHGHKGRMEWANLQQGKRCKRCAVLDNADKQRMSYEEVSEYFSNHGCRLLESEYINWKMPMRYICICGGEDKKNLSDFKSGRRCQKCGRERTTKETIKRGGKQFLGVVPKIHDNKYDYSEVDYRGGWVHVKIGCPKHGIFEQYPQIHIRGSGCPKCNESSGERKVSQVLKELDLQYKTQVRFDTCKNKKRLPFDFLVKVGNDKGFLIEYQGLYHYQPWKMGSMTDDDAKNRLKYVQNNDEIKRKWCNEHDIPLLVIPYWEKPNIRKIIDEFQRRSYDQTKNVKV